MYGGQAFRQKLAGGVRSVPDEVVAKSIKKADFSDRVDDWRIATHDVYGGQFYRAWEVSSEPLLTWKDLTKMAH